MKWVLVVLWLSSGQPSTSEAEYQERQTCFMVGAMSAAVLIGDSRNSEIGFACLPREGV